MNIKITPFKEVFILKPKVNLDERGSFMESYNEKQIENFQKIYKNDLIKYW